MKKNIVVLFTALFMVMSCATNPFTGSKTMALVNNSSIFPQSFQEYDNFIKSNKVIKGTNDAKRVEEVGKRIKGAAEKWLNANGYKGYLDSYRWDYNLVKNDQVNAWCMPGGKIVFYTGILPICKTEAGIATVMGHEVAHALANHGQQRMSATMIQKTGAQVIGAVTSNSKESTKHIANTAYDVGTNYLGILPFSRSSETEADKIGLTLMAIAGYNPEESVAFWSRMDAAAKGSKPMEFMSTHPSSNTRIKNLQKLIPEAKAEAAKFGVVFN